MREIKFRAWDGEKMDYEVTIYRDRFIACHFAHEDIFSNWHDPSEQIAIMQYTGLKDKNGKEIYEGDLLRYPGDKNNFTAYEVFFHDGNANTEYNIGYSINRAHHHGSICGGVIPQFKPKQTKHMIICGNIYQNPELL